MRTRYTTRLSALLLVLLASLMFAACGGDDSDDSSKDDSTTTTQSTDDSSSDDSSADDSSSDDSAADGQVLDLGVDGNNLAFDKTELTAKAGTVTLKLTNTSSIQHNVALEDADGNQIGESGDLVGEGGTSEVTAELEPGTYTYYCDPHKSAGMVGKLVVS